MNKDFDRRLRISKGATQYHLDKVKAGRSGSSAGKPRPYAKRNMLKARLHSPLLVGCTLTVSPKHPYLSYGVGRYYEWSIIETGVGTINGFELEADTILEHFIVIPKRRANEIRQKEPHKEV